MKEPMKSIMEKTTIIIREFKGESDRAVVVLAAAMLDEALEQLLKTYLVAIPTSKDDLLDGPLAPMSTLSARIDSVYRLGLISHKLCRDLHIIRKIRNHFAHNIRRCTFQDPTVYNRMFELKKSFSSRDTYHKLTNSAPKGERVHFTFITGLATFYLHLLADRTSPINQHSLETLYVTPSAEKT